MFIFRATSSYFLSVHDLVLTALCPVHRLLQVVLHHVHLPRNLFILPLCPRSCPHSPLPCSSPSPGRSPSCSSSAQPLHTSSLHPLQDILLPSAYFPTVQSGPPWPWFPSPGLSSRGPPCRPSC